MVESWMGLRQDPEEMRSISGLRPSLDMRQPAMMGFEATLARTNALHINTSMSSVPSSRRPWTGQFL